ncbi:MAG: NAD(+)/NADH kinase [Anaerolineales bacterium]|nr:NAD(+)/NADH kinase [Anaerolineales bacterium]MCS7246791.1 NAD(+)/NADH kinase [Anaerolineales bacterium]MDW8160601.1 NAD(+)/NADH kinase [Anaerolineales bacterium]MDW8446124.1 NAD(+)/NADH kinase [Anaerolineales bacterium]
MNEKNPSTFRKIAIAAHPSLPEANKEAYKIAHFLKQQGQDLLLAMIYEEKLTHSIDNREIDLLIALGGDGTMLRAGHLCGPKHIPILGINAGRFGFLMEIRLNEWRQYLPRLFKGDYWLEKRMMLTCIHKRGANELSSHHVLNEVVVGRGQTIRPVHLETHVDGRYLTTYVADALIAATATGSTAYALAAGGPILPPELRNILLVAVAPHLSIDRGIVLAEGSSVQVIVHTDHDALLCIDGQPAVPLLDGDQVEVYASEHNALFIRFQDPGYFYRNLTPHMNRNPATGLAR